MQTTPQTKDLVLTALFVALVAVMTMAVQVPMPMTEGYIHLGDSVILLVAVFFGKRKGALAGGIGSALADILTGYAHWAIFTLIIKALMGYVAGSIATYKGGDSKFFSFNTLTAGLSASMIMVLGYLLGGWILKGSLAVAVASIPGNALQALMGFALFLVIGKAFDKAQLYKHFPKI